MVPRCTIEKLKVPYLGRGYRCERKNSMMLRAKFRSLSDKTRQGHPKKRFEWYDILVINA